VAEPAIQTSLMAWMAEPYGKTLPFSTIDPVSALIGPNPTRLRVYAALRRMLEEQLERVGFDVWGAVSHGKGIYGRKGLYERERKEFESVKGFVDGWLASTQGAEADALMDALTEEWLRVAKVSPTPPRGTGG
jgi:ABC-type amino acid transport substrate-binding protein